MELDRLRGFELASDLLLLVGLNAHFFLAFLFAVLGIWRVAKSGVIGSDIRQFAVTWSKELLRAFVCLGYLIVDRVGHLVARVVDESPRDVVFGLSFRLRCFDVAPARHSHGSDKARSLRVD